MKQREPIAIFGAGVAGLAAGTGMGLLVAVCGVLTRPAAFLLGLLPRRFSHYLLGGELVALHSRLLGVYAGLALTLVCGFALWRRYLCRRPDFHFLKTRRGKFLFAVLVVLALLTLSLSVNRAFWDDEIEHVHASWYVHDGQVPYRDFFEHHHPLLWFLLAPVISILGEGLAVLAVLRLLMLLMAAGIGWLTWRISRLAGGDGETGFLALAILFANFMFLPCVMEVRPDVPMTLLALAAVERLLVYLQEGRTRVLMAAAFLASVSLLFLQKSAFLVAAMILWVAWKTRDGKIRPAHCAVVAVVFLLPLLAFLAWLASRGAWHDYFVCNWLVNLRRAAHPALWLDIGRMALVNIVFWIAVPLALFHAFRKKTAAAEMKMLAWFSVVALSLLLFYPNPGDRHFLLPLPLLSIAVSAWFSHRNGPMQHSKVANVLLTMLLVVPLPFLLTLNFPLNGGQLEKFAYVLRQTKPDDRVLDGRNDFNLFRPDVHYFWFQANPGELLDSYQRINGGRHAAYDPCRLIREQKPRFIFLNNREWRACGVWREYLLTLYPDLFIREEGT